KAEAEKMFPGVVSMLDRLAQKGIIHKNKAANLKSKLAKSVAKL
ncbi:MAG TPA: 30S ribosomal protein S20, partial [Bacteroidales bacterium]|nr:30S ribosomal protein S20 [Bacteroidales bacterium]